MSSTATTTKRGRSHQPRVPELWTLNGMMTIKFHKSTVTDRGSGCWGAIAQFGGQTPLNLALGGSYR
jgi:hypothetical protein